MKQYQRAIVFTKIPLGGYYRYKDVFQIFPASFDKMPDSSFKRDYPNILEYWISDEEKIPQDSEYENLKDLMTLTAATTTKQDKIISLLSVFTNNVFFRYTNYDGVWAIPMLQDEITEEMNTWSAKWCITGFHFPELPQQLQIKEFTIMTLEEVKKKPHKLFYTFYPNLENDQTETIIIPTTFDTILDSYFSLEKQNIAIIDSAIGFAVSSMELFPSKKTLSMLASFTSMEAMVNLEYQGSESKKCKECNQLSFSVAKKFKEYLLKYVGSSIENKKKFNLYYSLRSKIVHIGRRLKAEVLFSDFSKDELNEEYITRIEILQIAKIAIANWLIINK